MNKKIFKEILTMEDFINAEYDKQILTMEDFINAEYDKQFKPQNMQSEINLIPTNLPEQIKQIRIQEIKEKWSEKEDV